MLIEIKRNYNLKKILKEKGIKQYELARAVGIDESLISRHIIGARELQNETKEKIANILGVKKEEI